MTAKEIYAEAYRLLDTATPLGAVDCGKLCGKACCKDGGNADAGMYLFPGEEAMFSPRPDWILIKPSAFTYGPQNKHALIAMCKGRCARHLRPLSCRIFPLTPYKPKGFSLTIIPDPRAKAMCPLSDVSSLERLDNRFVENTWRVFRVLSRIGVVREFIEELSELIDEYRQFW